MTLQTVARDLHIPHLEVGDQVAVTFIGPSDVEVAYGRLGVCSDYEGTLTHLVVEGDGSATWIRRTLVLAVQREDA
jgi:hypothetical protein